MDVLLSLVVFCNWRFEILRLGLITLWSVTFRPDWSFRSILGLVLLFGNLEDDFVRLPVVVPVVVALDPLESVELEVVLLVSALVVKLVP